MNTETDPPAREVPLCPRCIKEVPSDAQLCPECKLPISPLAFSLEPHGAFIEGQMYGEMATQRRPSRLALVGAWLMLIPAVASACVAIGLDESEYSNGRFARWAFGVAAVASGTFFVMLVVRMTHRRRRTRSSSHQPE